MNNKKIWFRKAFLTKNQKMIQAVYNIRLSARKALCYNKKHYNDNKMCCTKESKWQTHSCRLRLFDYIIKRVKCNCLPFFS